MQSTAKRNQFNESSIGYFTSYRTYASFTNNSLHTQTAVRHRSQTSYSHYH